MLKEAKDKELLDKKILERVRKLKSEKVDLTRRIIEIEDKSVKDSVRSSSKYFPYIQHTTVIEGIGESKKKRRFKNILKRKEAEIDKLLLSVEYELNHIEDPELREMIRCKYYDGMTYFQISNYLNEKYNTYKYNDDNIRKKINRFFEKK